MKTTTTKDTVVFGLLRVPGEFIIVGLAAIPLTR